MAVTDVVKDLDNATITIVSEFDAGPDRVWQLWEDPRLLEKWWGPPTYPATVVDHDLNPGGVVTYYMTGPEGDQPWGRWDVKTVEKPRLIEIEDSFAEEGGERKTDLPSGSMRVEIEEIEGAPGRTRMSIAQVSTSTEALQEMLDMGMEEGMKQALGQVDALL